MATTLMKPGDRLLIIHVIMEDAERKDYVEQMAANFRLRLAADGLLDSGSKFMPVPDVGGITVHEIIHKVLVEENADYLVVVPDIEEVADMSDICLKLVNTAPCNVVVCKK